MLEIKEATIEDVPTILHFVKAIAEYEKLSHLVKATEDSISATLFSKPGFAKCIIALEDLFPVGFAIYFYNYSTFVSKPGIYLEDLYVEPQFRGKGYGKALLLEIIKIAKQNNCGRVEWSVLNWNKPAIDFYNSIGAKPLNEWTIFRVDEDLINKLA